MDPLEDPKLLPSQAFTTAAALLEVVDRKVLVSLRDGRRLFGILRSFDQFANLVLQDTVERIYFNNMFGEQRHGVFIVRGENVALVGEIDPEKEDYLEENRLPGSTGSLKQVPFKEIEKLLEDNINQMKAADKHASSVLMKYGFEKERLADNLY